MKVTKTDLPGVLLLEPTIFTDDRGSLVETWHAPRYAACGIPTAMVQDNVSVSRQSVLRGLHYQCPHSQGKLVCVLDGTIFDVAVDIRLGSPTFGRWLGTELSGGAARQLYIPQGFAHGFCVLSEQAVVAYKCTDIYRPECDFGIRWDDPEIGIAWPLASPVLSAKDRAHLHLRNVPRERLPQYASPDADALRTDQSLAKGPP